MHREAQIYKADSSVRGRRPSHRKLIRTLRKLKAIIPPPTTGPGPEDVADFLERLVANYELVLNTRAVRSPDAPMIDAMDLPPSPPSSPMPPRPTARQPLPNDAAAEANAAAVAADRLDLLQLPCLAPEALADLADRLCALGPVRI